MEKSFVALNYGGNQIALGSVEATDVNISSNITSYPIYSGDTVGEHMIREPITMTIRGSYATNGSNSVLVNAIAPSLKLFQQEIEKLRDNGTLVDIYKLAYNQNDPRFIKRTGMALKSIAWVEHFNSVEFSFSFQQVMVSDKVYTGNSSAYSTTPSGGDPNYNPKTGNIDVPETNEKIPTAREPGKTSNEDGIEIIADNDVPSFDEPYAGTFVQDRISEENLMAMIIALCLDNGIVDEAFLRRYRDKVTSAGVISSISALAIGLVLDFAVKGLVTKFSGAAIAAGLSAGAGVPGGVIVIGAAAAIATVVGAAYLLYALVQKLQNAEQKRKYKRESFTLKQGIQTSSIEAENNAKIEKFSDFLQDIYNEAVKFGEYFLEYDFPNGEDHQSVTITVRNTIVEVETERTINGLGIRFKAANETVHIPDMYEIAITDFLSTECAPFGFFDGDEFFYGYLLFKDPEMTNMKTVEYEQTTTGTEVNGVHVYENKKAKPSDFSLVISSMQPVDFANELAKVVCNHIYTNYKDITGE